MTCYMLLLSKGSLIANLLPGRSLSFLPFYYLATFFPLFMTVSALEITSWVLFGYLSFKNFLKKRPSLQIVLLVVWESDSQNFQRSYHFK